MSETLEFEKSSTGLIFVLGLLSITIGTIVYFLHNLSLFTIKGVVSYLQLNERIAWIKITEKPANYSEETVRLHYNDSNLVVGQNVVVYVENDNHTNAFLNYNPNSRRHVYSMILISIGVAAAFSVILYKIVQHYIKK
jgi:hypothetical protein